MKRINGLTIIERALNKIRRKPQEPFYWFGKYYKKHDLLLINITKQGVWFKRHKI